MGYTCLNSSANFVLATTPDGNGCRVYEYLKENGVLVRFFDAPRLRDKLRITVGTDEEAEKLISALKRM
jgi:histidinol-phosphate aminotransferase